MHQRTYAQAKDSSTNTSSFTPKPTGLKPQRPFNEQTDANVFVSHDSSLSMKTDWSVQASPQEPLRMEDINKQLERGSNIPSWMEKRVFNREEPPNTPPAGVQFKLTIGKLGDQYEVEADRVADRVMSMPEAATSSQQVQRQGEGEEAIQRQSLVSSITQVVQLQTKPNPLYLFNNSRGLTPDEITYAKQIFGDSIDYSRVRISRNPIGLVGGASKTVLNTIYLQSNWGGPVFQPDGINLTSQGKELLIHEMTHVWQYQNGGVAYIPESLAAQAIALMRTGNRNNAYHWEDLVKPEPKNRLPWADWNPEQQASAVEAYNIASRNIKLGRPSERDRKNEKNLRCYIRKVRRGEGASTLTTAAIGLLSGRPLPRFPHPNLPPGECP